MERTRGAPRGAETRAVRLKVESRTPYAEAGVQTVWRPGHALNWSWDKEGVAFPDGSDGKGWLVLPETLFIAAPDEDGPRLVEGVDGFDGQVWQDGSLMASRWWPGVPSPEEWALFAQGAGLDDIRLPRIAETPWLARPWGMTALSSEIVQRIVTSSWQTRLLVAACALSSVAGWRYGEFSTLGAELGRIEAQIASTEADAERFVRDRRAAEAIRRQGEDLAASLSTPTPSGILSVLLDAIDTPVTVERFVLVMGEVTAVFSADPLPEGEAMVARLEALGLFDSVLIEPDPVQGSLTVRAGLAVPQTPQGDPDA